MDITRQACGVNSFHVSLIRDIHVIYKLRIKLVNEESRLCGTSLLSVK